MTPTNMLASTLGLEYGELKEYRYQPTRTKCAIYAIGNFYYTISKTPPEFAGVVWSENRDQFFARDGYKIYIGKSE